MTCKKKSNCVEVGHTTDIDDKGNGVVVTAGEASFSVKCALPGDTVYISSPSSRRKKRSKRAFLTRIISTSWHRIAPFCMHYGVCGGCTLQHLSYDEQRALKYDALSRLLSPYEGNNTSTGYVIPAKTTVYYRNRVDYSFGAVRWVETHEGILPSQADRRGLGFHVQGFYDKVVHINQCFLHASNDVRKTVHQWALDNDISYYNSRTHEGLLRLMTVRITLCKQIMVVLHFAQESKYIASLCRALVKAHPEINSLYSVINTSRNDCSSHLAYTLMHGSPSIEEICGHLKLKIYPQVFYQTNSEAAQHLYEVIASYADVHADDTVLDLYCGIGSIGLFVAHSAHRVIGIDIVPQSIETAKENAVYNNIANAHFFAVASEHVVVNATLKNNEDAAENTMLKNALCNAQRIIVDPPRAGLHKSVIAYLCSLKPTTLVYVSCNPTTLARDLEQLSTRYTVEQWQAIDMFPHTHHVETVVKLKPTMK